MKVPGLRSPHDKVGGIVYFGRMLDKIRLNSSGSLPSDYIANLGDGFDGMCTQFLGVDYSAMTEKFKEGDSDESALEWCLSEGRRPTDGEILIWNEFLRKRGWNDAGSERLKQRKAESDLTDREDIQTFFDYIDTDEGRPIRQRSWAQPVV